MPEDPREKGQPRLKPERAVFLTHLFSALVYPLWLAGIWLAPYLRSRASPWSSLAYAFYSPVCHQVPGRSFSCFGQPLAVCARCLGIYLGFLVGLGLFPFLRRRGSLSLPPARVFFLVSGPIVLDTAGNFLGLWSTPGSIRLATGIIWGTILPFYFIAGVSDLLIARQKNRLKSRPASP
jgi:uncharacterized membrane protein